MKTQDQTNNVLCNSITQRMQNGKIYGNSHTIFLTLLLDFLKVTVSQPRKICLNLPKILRFVYENKKVMHFNLFYSSFFMFHTYYVILLTFFDFFLCRISNLRFWPHTKIYFFARKIFTMASTLVGHVHVATLLKGDWPTI